MGKMLRRGVGHTIGEGTGQGGVQAKAQRSGLGPGGWWGRPETESGRKSRFGRDTKVILRCSGHKGSRTLGGGIEESTGSCEWSSREGWRLEAGMGVVSTESRM